MRTSARFALCVGVAATLLIGCGGSPSVNLAPTVIDPLPRQQQTFNYTGAEQTFTVPSGVTTITVDALGAAGGGCCGTGPTFGFGGRVRAQLPVRPREPLYVFVGGIGTMPKGGFNGGGPGRKNSKILAYSSFGGGGASDIREGGTSLRNRVIVAGGGGGSGGFELEGNGTGAGGAGGGNIAGSGSDGSYMSNGGAYGGSGGSQETGGAGGQGGTGTGRKGSPGADGSLGTGGSGGLGGRAGNGGGAGGGYYGGGGGGGAGSDTCTSSGCYGGGGGGGGGGSAYHERTARNYKSWQGWMEATGNGVVVISW